MSLAGFLIFILDYRYFFGYKFIFLNLKLNYKNTTYFFKDFENSTMNRGKMTKKKIQVVNTQRY